MKTFKTKFYPIISPLRDVGLSLAFNIPTYEQRAYNHRFSYQWKAQLRNLSPTQDRYYSLLILFI